MELDTGKAIISPYSIEENIVLVDIYVDGELQANDIDDIHKAIEKCNLQSPVNTICLKSGKNFLSDDAFNYLMKRNCIHNKVVYVIKHMADIHFPSQVQKTYFKEHIVDYCTSTDEAYHLLLNI